MEATYSATEKASAVQHFIGRDRALGVGASIVSDCVRKRLQVV